MPRLFRRAPRGNTARVQPWGQAKLLLALVGVAVAALGLVVGMGVATRYAIQNASEPADTTAGVTTTHDGSEPAEPLGSVGQASGDQARAAIAAEPMLQAGSQGYRPQGPGTRPAETITIPPATGAGGADVPTGFPRTPQGAVGQLAAIDTTVLQAMDIRVATRVYQAWARPGGLGARDWELTRNVATFLGATNNQSRKDTTTVVIATPVAGQVKGVDGPDWAVACVLLRVRASAQAEAQIGYGHCEQMVWHADTDTDANSDTDSETGRWMIAPGTPPAPAPSTWPGTELARQAGWLDWVQGEGER